MATIPTTIERKASTSIPSTTELASRSPMHAHGGAGLTGTCVDAATVVGEFELSGVSLTSVTMDKLEGGTEKVLQYSVECAVEGMEIKSMSKKDA